jgi:threonine/homoserine/homoserine lactone efflux protein
VRQAGLCAVFDRYFQSKRYSLFVSFFPQFIAISRDFTTSITTLCLLWILFDFAVMAGYIVAIKRFLPVTQSRRFAACAASFYCCWLCGLPGTLRARNRSLCDEMILSLPE